MKFKQIYLVGISLCVFLLIMDFLYFFGESSIGNGRFFYALVIISLSMAWLQFWLDFFKEGKKQKEIEEKFTEFVRAIVKFISKRKILFAIFGFFERAFKKMTLGCRECDDCAIFETYYLCPESKCPKGMRIGPCGGSRVDGRCEVFEKRYCLWEKVYWRAKNRKQLEKLEYIINPRDWGLYETSSWANYFLSLDHSAKTIDISGKDN